MTAKFGFWSGILIEGVIKGILSLNRRIVSSVETSFESTGLFSVAITIVIIAKNVYRSYNIVNIPIIFCRWHTTADVRNSLIKAFVKFYSCLVKVNACNVVRVTPAATGKMKD